MSFPWQKPGLTADEQAAAVVAEMTTDEKFAWLSGPMAIPLSKEDKLPPEAIGSAAYYPAIPRLGIPALQQSDASLGVSALGGVRPGDHSTALASSLALGASFDPELAQATGEMLGREAFGKGFNVQLAGGANLIREPRGGRNFEYISEDPLLTGVMAGFSVRGIQSQHVVSTVKHFAVNAQETGRVLADSRISESALRESDLLAFELAIEIGKPGAVMPGYNLVNGDWASENHFLLSQVLKGDWQYPGWVMSDWGATHSATKAVRAGLDVQSGANLDQCVWFDQPLRHAIDQGEIPATQIDNMIQRILRSLFACGAIQHPAQRGNNIDYSWHQLIAQREAEQGIVLLKNENQTLPLPPELARIVVVGAHADKGVLAGGGSSAVTPQQSLQLEGVDFMGIQTPKVYHPSSPLAAIRRNSLAKQVDFISGESIEDALEASQGSDAVIIFAEEWRSEALDAQGLELDDHQNQLIEQLSAVHPKVVVVLETGGAVALPWLDKVPALLEAWYPGLGGAEAIAGILFGRVNPAGRLPITFPAHAQQLPHPTQIDPSTTTSLPGVEIKGDIFPVDYDVEGADVGYRWFERQQHTPLFPFGYGLSYTQFRYEDLQLCQTVDDITASLTITNSGDRSGSDVIQVYLRPLSGRYPARLVAFRKVTLAAGETQRISLSLEPRVIAQWDSTQQHWSITEEDYIIYQATDAATPILSGKLRLAAKTFGYPLN
ncbi:beta-glucosidase family protein [Tatumella ptyseos]|uniref:beta-glucosidase family protein n=1 Tax=Tatumella ptyseos TaxID=82987 RepID=UPI0026EE9495|nr:glycoside hydrolase family 3 C-terminal domain-containing protein [Tatumella ptyseos]WKX26946.1 glycoside hydrolase family 3 C-terminal domain-containing protein [Tatumella ptyseos]